ncbi:MULTISPECIES: cytosine deaminase [unclassified Microcystis]|uniref:Cytosine deaminase n=1 Tax=Microcystis flos-aquae Mf_QC_C_20070823_S10D TaxID=2486236 RepID=A0A552KMZ1_9CHRO|nr:MULTISPECIES: cytosine deaminase [unclassified Microcystis]MCA2815436.1 cytosine deaminase [Microcystis sp. M085S1]MCA2856487.1 cytosine deaminase [Microcystis sp. M065S1]TRT97030.1 MAG: cytosine deaminase [Microcystis flos-aquae Ma_QC_C_20070823_S18D]TRV09342.1 MAG: cytosine deaminase [Microcystis flos-aquae Mf_QC_C_20070823_S10D]TRV28740.1 MAG: cytosine deaminase [Microcystis flos-aquae Mf_QC_C_20070823_S10]TRV29786.1 MAG: cytosine deaminase [Microcystis flos-aquae Mf_QC_C_20070823_S20]
MIPSSERYWLKNAHIPVSLLENESFSPQNAEGLTLVNLEINDGNINRITSTIPPEDNIPVIDLKKKIVFPCFVDMHTHLDKGHSWQRCPNHDGTFDGALKMALEDSRREWRLEDVYRRMEFGVKCSYAHGTAAIRTHIDSFGQQAQISLTALAELQRQWAGKITLQAVSLVSLDYYQTSEGAALADKIAEFGGILGGVAYTNPDLQAQIDITFKLAQERGLNLDFHLDENGDSDSTCLAAIARTAIKEQFDGQIICGHCCSLAVQSPEIIQETLNLVKNAGIAIVSLPMCNLYLQDRQEEKTPFWRGTTKIKEMKKAGIPVAFASDNCRDPFYGFGDHDGLEVFTQAVRIAHLDTPYADWVNSVTLTPANLLGLPHLGRIKTGLEANLLIFKARYFSELLSRPQWDRLVIRRGLSIDTTLPDYQELDDLVLGIEQLL